MYVKIVASASYRPYLMHVFVQYLTNRRNIMVKVSRHSNVNWASLNNLRVVTADTGIIQYRLIQVCREIPYHDANRRECTLTPLLENHVLTVLADIHYKNLTGYGNSFVESQGTEEKAYYARKLEQDVKRWTARLEAYLQTAFAQGRIDSPAVQIARNLHDKLANAIQTGKADNHH